MSPSQALIRILRVFYLLSRLLIVLYRNRDGVNLILHFVCRCLILIPFCPVVRLLSVCELFLLLFGNQPFLAVRQAVVCIPGVLNRLFFLFRVLRRHSPNRVNFFFGLFRRQPVVFLFCVSQLLFFLFWDHVFLASSQAVISLPGLLDLLRAFPVMLYRHRDRVNLFHHSVHRCLVLPSRRLVIGFFRVGQLLQCLRGNLLFLLIGQAVIRVPRVLDLLPFLFCILNSDVANGVNFFFDRLCCKPVIFCFSVGQFL